MTMSAETLDVMAPQIWHLAMALAGCVAHEHNLIC